MQRAEANAGLLPDNVGLAGQVGDYVGGHWFGGLYGWAWPHGFYNIQAAALVAAQSCFLLTKDARYLDLPRKQYEHILALGETRNMDAEPMSLGHHWVGQRRALDANQQTFLVPYRYDGQHWFDYQPLSPVYPAALWNMTGNDQDWESLQALRAKESYDWRDVYAFRTKEDAGHEQPWLEFLAGRNPTYPEAILRQAYGQVCWRLDRIRADDADLARVNIHHWQERNPVTTEALVQLTLGAPQIIYNGGLLVTPLRYFDGSRARPGLPRDVAALVTGVTQNAISLSLVNLSLIHAHDVLIQAGAFGEHRFTQAHYDGQARDSIYPLASARYSYGAGEVSPPNPQPTEYVIPIHAPLLHVNLPPGTTIQLRLGLDRYANPASYLHLAYEH
jgi:hypothetical protein